MNTILNHSILSSKQKVYEYYFELFDFSNQLIDLLKNTNKFISVKSHLLVIKFDHAASSNHANLFSTTC